MGEEVAENLIRPPHSPSVFEYVNNFSEVLPRAGRSQIGFSFFFEVR